MSIHRRLVAGLVALTLLLAGCERPTANDPGGAYALTRPDWHPVVLPMPPGPAGRVLLRDAVACADRWYLVGAIGGADGATRPAAWTSADARTWTAVRLAPTSYYGERAILYAAGCRDGRIAVIGAKAGGAHGNRGCGPGASYRTGRWWRCRPSSNSMADPGRSTSAGWRVGPGVG